MLMCDRCGAEIQVGMFPFCKGNKADHGSVISKTALFPFETPHIDGKPMVIESLEHLRKVERQYGVVLSAFSKANINDLDPISNPPGFRGNDEDVLHDTRHRRRR